MAKNYNKSHLAEAEIEQQPIEANVEDPVVEEKAPVVKPTIQRKKTGKVVVITRTGCIVDEGNHSCIQLFGKDYLQKKVGDIIEF